MAMNMAHFHTHDSERRIGDNQVLISRDAFDAMTAELEELRKHEVEFDATKARIKELEAENRWHRCDVPNEDGLYDLPPEDGEYIVEFVSGLGKVTICASEYDADYNYWDASPFNSEARQWREMPKAPEVT